MPSAIDDVSVAASASASVASSQPVSFSIAGSSKASTRPANRQQPFLELGYELRETLGEGEFGKVKLAFHSGTGNKVAIKVFKRSRLDDEEKQLKLMREISILNSVVHKSIVRLFEVLETDELIGLVIELLDQELFDYILNNKFLPEPEAGRLFAQLVDGVNYLHAKGVVHRDLKLENLLLSSENNLVIIDFGFANQFPSRAPDAHDAMQFATPERALAVPDRHFLMATSCGSPCYAAPELVVADGYVGTCADVWSCGVILFAMLAGYLPFDDDPENPHGDNITLLYKYILSDPTPLHLPPHLSPDAQDLLSRMLVPDPELRLTMREVMDHAWLAPFRAVFNVDYSLPPPVPQKDPHRRRSRTPTSSVGSPRSPAPGSIYAPEFSPQMQPQQPMPPVSSATSAAVAAATAAVLAPPPSLTAPLSVPVLNGAGPTAMDVDAQPPARAATTSPTMYAYDMVLPAAETGSERGSSSSSGNSMQIDGPAGFSGAPADVVMSDAHHPHRGMTPPPRPFSVDNSQLSPIRTRTDLDGSPLAAGPTLGLANSASANGMNGNYASSTTHATASSSKRNTFTGFFQKPKGDFLELLKSSISKRRWMKRKDLPMTKEETPTRFVDPAPAPVPAPAPPLVQQQYQPLPAPAAAPTSHGNGGLLATLGRRGDDQVFQRTDVGPETIQHVFDPTAQLPGVPPAAADGADDLPVHRHQRSKSVGGTSIVDTFRRGARSLYETETVYERTDVPPVPVLPDGLLSPVPLPTPPSGPYVSVYGTTSAADALLPSSAMDSPSKQRGRSKSTSGKDRSTPGGHRRGRSLSDVIMGRKRASEVPPPLPSTYFASLAPRIVGEEVARTFPAEAMTSHTPEMALFEARKILEGLGAVVVGHATDPVRGIPGHGDGPFMLKCRIKIGKNGISQARLKAELDALTLLAHDEDYNPVSLPTVAAAAAAASHDDPLNLDRDTAPRRRKSSSASSAYMDSLSVYSGYSVGGNGAAVLPEDYPPLYTQPDVTAAIAAGRTSANPSSVAGLTAAASAPSASSAPAPSATPVLVPGQLQTTAQSYEHAMLAHSTHAAEAANGMFLHDKPVSVHYSSYYSATPTMSAQSRAINEGIHVGAVARTPTKAKLGGRFKGFSFGPDILFTIEVVALPGQAQALGGSGVFALVFHRTKGNSVTYGRIKQIVMSKMYRTDDKLRQVLG
ncbi:hypothetical protein H9P43_000321 [Blastocladiella emersonii ATCC 22665]|nr:hypothetical protein H9P43_000321 [Blastocladiella emersonii ATCC 22665]